MFCANCGKEISKEGKFCKFCGAGVKDDDNTTSIDLQPTGDKFSNAQPIWHLILLSVITFAIYEIYWFYRNWKHLKIYKKLNISPGWRTVGLIVPILNIFLVYNQFKDIRGLARQAKCVTYSSPGWLALGYIFVSGISFRLTLSTWNWTDPTGLLGIAILTLLIDLLALWFLIIVQKTLNGYWKKEQPDLGMRTEFSGIEIALLVIGGISWLLYLAGIFLPE